MNKSTHRYRTDSLLVLLAALALPGQPKATTAPAHPLRFEVVSIRRNKSGGPTALQTLPDSYRAINISLGLSIMKAYIPGNLELAEPIQGEPDWIHQEMYDVIAKVDPSDIPEWQKQTWSHQPMLQAMLQAMLAERCKLVVHQVPRQAPGWALVVAKQGPKLHPMKPGETLDGQPLPEEGRLVGHRPGDKPQVSLFGFPWSLSQSGSINPRPGLQSSIKPVSHPATISSSSRLSTILLPATKM